jgi:hypothetical protein
MNHFGANDRRCGTKYGISAGDYSATACPLWLGAQIKAGKDREDFLVD